MQGKYKIKETEIDSYFQRHSTKVIIVMALFFLVIIVVTAIRDDFITTFDIGLVLFFTLSIAIVLAILFNQRIKDDYQNFYLILEEDRIIREGKNIHQLEIKYSDISKIVSRYNYSAVLKKGLSNNLAFYGARNRGINDLEYIMIPSILEDYNEVVSYIYSKSQENREFEF